MEACGVCEQFTNAPIIYCFSGNLTTDKTSRDLKAGTTHWVCRSCYDTMKENGTHGTCPYCRASTDVAAFEQKAAPRVVYKWADME